MIEYRFCLYITGDTPRSKIAMQNLHRICERYLAGKYEIELVDVLEQPDRAEADRVMATPTLIKVMPPPRSRVIGDLNREDLVLTAMSIHGTAQEGSAKK